MKRFLSFLFTSLPTFILTACSTTHTITGPDGTPHQLLSCSNIKYCYSQALEVCDGKYKIINTSNEIYSDPYGVTSTTKLLVKCEKAVPSVSNEAPSQGYPIKHQ